ncbi:MAG: bifunctional DNA-formamidopyrimidine glycosylase/DNA-(apurinic or apyrimidinic site) lyase [Patescibacteria group bacterium]|nr:bifunctional DNA-formamidopyrimidine glycosylase/DNA-(apurinic or apyrimidinic site) lyase [Patescibacteria group bacterium]
MPELPEVETIRTQLADKLIGRTIVDVDVRLAKMWEGSRDQVLGSRITDVQRRAKIIVLRLDNGKNIVVHLKMTGQLVYGHGTAETISFSQGIPFAGMTLPGKTTHVIFSLDNNAKLFFNDMRQFGWVRVMSNEQLAMSNEKFGPEALGKEFTPEYLAKICANWGRPIKLLLMEQGKIAGIGNIYANEALWCAGISPMKRARELESRKVGELHKCVREVLEKGLKYGGSSAADEAFVNVEGKKGHMQEHFVVYQKQGQPCPRCGKTITVSRLGGRGTFFCPKCQK